MRNREEAARAAEADRFNQVGTCQLTTRIWLDSPSVGDYDGDGRADAEDGWKSEPASARHTSRTGIPRGLPVSFLGGRNDDGHRALSLGNGRFRSTDWDTVNQRYKAGVVGTAYSLEALERGMGVTYAGWSTTIGGKEIPSPPPPKPTRLELFHKSGPPRYNFRLVDNAIGKGSRRDEAKLIRIREEIEREINRLPRDADSDSLVSRFRSDFRNKREIRLGLLNVAIGRGRMGTVRQVRDALRELIAELPKR